MKYAKKKNLPKPLRSKFGYGDVWTWVAIDADTKLVPCWLVAERDAGAAGDFIQVGEMIDLLNVSN